MQLSRLRLAFAVALSLAAITISTPALHAQFVDQPSCRWSIRISPSELIAARIRAETEFLKTMNERPVNAARARGIQAQARQQEIENSVDAVRAYWLRREIGEAERLKRYVAPLDRKRIQNSKTWERLKDHPDLNGSSIADGQALNFLLDRLSGTVLAYQFSVKQPGANTFADVRLSDDVLNKLRLRQDLADGKRLVFRANEGIPLAVDWWPAALRREELTLQRQALEQSRAQLVEQAKRGELNQAKLEELLQSLAELNAAFRDLYRRERRLESMDDFRDYLAGKRFIQSLAGEVGRLQETGDLSAFDGSLRFQGDNLVSLLTYMSRTGLEFAPSSTGDEHAYQTVFQMMRDMYITVAETGSGPEASEPQE